MSKTIMIIIIIIILTRVNCKLYPLKFEGHWILHPKISEFKFCLLKFGVFGFYFLKFGSIIILNPQILKFQGVKFVQILIFFVNKTRLDPEFKGYNFHILPLILLILWIDDWYGRCKKLSEFPFRK